MTDSDLSLYPFISAFVTTNVSEQLWFSRGTKVTALPERTVSTPDGKQVRIMVASDQSRVWATPCNSPQIGRLAKELRKKIISDFFLRYSGFSAGDGY